MIWQLKKGKGYFLAFATEVIATIAFHSLITMMKCVFTVYPVPQKRFCIENVSDTN